MAQVDLAPVGVGDFYTLKSDPTIRGIILQTWHDVDADALVIRNRFLVHKDLPHELQLQVKRTKFVPKGYVVLKILPLKFELLVHESDLVLLDRYFSRGDVVKRSPTDAQSGTVIGTTCSCTLRPYIRFTQEGQDKAVNFTSASKDPQIANVDAHRIQPYLPLNLGDTVIYDDWIGTINHVCQAVSVRMEDNSVVVIENANDVTEIVPEIPSSFAYVPLTRKLGHGKRPIWAIPCHPEQKVRVKRKALSTGYWLSGTYNATLPRNGTVIGVRLTQAEALWKTPRVNEPQAEVPFKPSALLPKSLLETGAVTRYDYNRSPKAAGGVEDQFSGLVYTVPHEYVILEDSTAVKSGDANLVAGDEAQAEQLMASPCKGTLAEITSTTSRVKVQWQDNSITDELSSSLCSYNEVDDYDVWPGEIVSLKGPEAVQQDSEYEKMLRTRAVGVVQSVNAVERIARIRWYQGADITITGEDNDVLVRPHSKLGRITQEVTESSLYEIASYHALTKRRGDLVSLQRPMNVAGQSGINWVGEVVDLLPNGLLLVRLAALDRVRDTKCSVLDLTVVISADDSTTDSDSLETMESNEWEDDTMIPGQLPITTSVRYEGPAPSDTPSNEEDQWETDSNSDVVSDDNEARDGSSERCGPCTPMETSTDVHEDGDVNAIEQLRFDLIRSTQPDPSLVYGQLEKTDLERLRKSLNKYIKRSILAGRTVPGVDQQAVVERIKQLIAHSLQTNTILTVDWDNLPLPHVMIQEDGSGLGDKDATMEETPFTATDLSKPLSFDILEESAPNHTFSMGSGSHSKEWLRAVSREHNIMRTSLPEGVYVRTWESDLELLRVLIVGPSGTPYAHAPFLFDLHLHNKFPLEAPKAFFHSWTNGVGRVNPNLYEDGKICLSLLGTWQGDEDEEEWVAGKSTVLQIIVSLLGLVLVKEPYYNEAGFEALQGTAQSKPTSAVYSEKAFVLSRGFVVTALQTLPAGFADIIKWLYLPEERGPCLLRTVVHDCQRFMQQESPPPSAEKAKDDRLLNLETYHIDAPKLSRGILVLLGKFMPGLEDGLRYHERLAAEAQESLEEDGQAMDVDEEDGKG
ncbi:MAG: hypothetical protein Q9224_004615 [Gallowayella concinna]